MLHEGIAAVIAAAAHVVSFSLGVQWFDMCVVAVMRLLCT